MDAIDLRDIIKDVIFAFEPKIRGKGLDLRVDVPKAAVPVRADKGKLKLAFEILVRNSLEAAESGYIAIYVTQSRDSVECSVSDTGPAIPKEDMGDIFERFSGFTRSASQDGSWTDPALYILRKVVEKHGGRVAVDIGHDNAVKFTIKLPSLSAATK
jgi:signal transduction histidine kinase